MNFVDSKLSIPYPGLSDGWESIGKYMQCLLSKTYVENTEKVFKPLINGQKNNYKISKIY